MIKYLFTFILLYIIVSFILVFIVGLMTAYKTYTACKLWLIKSEEIDMFIDFSLDEISWMVNGISIEVSRMINKKPLNLYEILCRAFSVVIFLGPISAMIIYKRDEIFNRAFLRLLDERG